MKQSTFRATPDKAGFIRTFLVPIHERHDMKFGPIDATMLLVVTFGAMFLARMLVAH